MKKGEFMTENIDDFILSLNVASLCVCYENSLYPFDAFFAYDKENSSIIFASDDKSEHSKIMKLSKNIAGTLALNTKMISKIQGLQFRGEVEISNDMHRKIYFKKFPYAIAMNPKLYVVKINWAKLTDNTLIFGKKTIWIRN